MEVYFRTTKEARYFCKSLCRLSNEMNRYWQSNGAVGKRLQFDKQNTSDAWNASKAMVDVLMQFHLSDIIYKLLQDKYYYTDQEEMNRILNLTEEFLREEPIKGTTLNTVYLKDMLQEVFYTAVCQMSSVHFDSIIQFRLAKWKEELLYWIGLAIDDFKREEEHQAFIHMLREYISNKKASHDMIHVKQGKTFTFYKKDGRIFTEEELKALMDKEPLYIVGLHGNEMNLSPFIAISPTRIKMYGSDPSEPKTQTIINVFQERVEFLAVSAFPFT